MEEKRVVDYFVVAGLPDEPEPIEEFSNETVLKPTHKQDPIVDIAVINRSLGEAPPPKFKCIEFTPTGFPADLNHGSIRAPEMYLCYRRGRDKPPLTDIGVLYEGKERVMQGCEVVYMTAHGRPANVNNSSSSKILVTFRRCDEVAACDTLAVTDICVILANKSETPPHAFCQINKTLNKGMVGSDVYLCYKKSMAKANFLVYRPALLGRYPLEDYEKFPLPESVPMFCLPLGATLECWPAKAHHPLPVFSTFVLTGAAGEKVYGAAVMFYEEYPKESLTSQQQTQLGLNQSPPPPNSEGKTVHQSKCICLLSRWPFFDPYKKFLSYLYMISISGPHNVPIERHISHFMAEVPYPSPQRPRILVQLNHEAISLSQPEETPLPQSGASFITLLKNLGPDNCMRLLLYTLMEQKILIHSLRPAVLTSVAESVANMIFPFHWQCPYIPLCPLGLSDVLNAPCPFIVGVDSRYFDMYDPPPDVTCVDLDTNTIYVPDEKKTSSHKMLPKRPAKVLKQTLERLFEKVCQDPSNPDTPLEVGFETVSIDMDFSKRWKELVMETAIQETFLRFMACLLKGYHNYLSPITKAPTLGTTDLSSLFDVQSFLKSRDKANHKFFTHMMKTQSFSRFIEERSFVSDKDASLAFFDECTEKVDEYKDEPKLIELEDNARSERTVFITPPEPIGLPAGVKYSYNGFPELNAELFPQKAKPSLLANVKKTPICPTSPMTRRTKQEIRSAQKIAQKQAATPQLWAKCLLGHCYSLWFIHLPAYVKSVHSKTKALRTAYSVLVKMQSAKLQSSDEVCYRVLMQLCGLYHQPALAVKVLFEMKRSGVQPNAITYGFYNKAVLESKWPSSESNAYLMWNKVRNAIMAVAQFRRALKDRRRSSMYSNSESDFDRISRASTDSYLDDIVPIEKLEGGKPEHVADLASVESPNSDEITSTGGMSDRGYSSMTLEDAKRIAIVIGSQDSLDSDDKVKAVKVNKVKNGEVRPCINKSLAPPKPRPAKKGNQDTGKDAMRLQFQPIDPTVDETFQKKIGSIFRKSVGSAGSGSTLRGSTCSSAGLLMTSHPGLENGVIGADLTAAAQSIRLRNWDQENKKKRHNSAGDFSHKQSQHVTAARPRHISTGCEDAILTVTVLEDVKEGGSPVSNGATPVYGISVQVTDKDVERTTNAPRKLPSDSGVCSESDSIMQNGGSSVCDSVSRTDQTAQDAADDDDDDDDDVHSTSVFKDDTSDTVDRSPEGTPEKGAVSPAHSLRTPVTENDPLGLFNIATDQDARTASDATADGSSDVPADSDTDRSQLLIDLGQPFSGTSTPVKNRLGNDTEKSPVAHNSPINSFSSSEASSPGSPLAAWNPLSLSQSQSGLQSPQIAEATAKSATLPLAEREHDPSDPDGDAKSVSRSESFGSALRSAASVFRSKFSEFKQSMSTPNKMDTGSNSSLTRQPPGEMEKLLTEESEDLFLKKAGSADQLNKPDDTESRMSLDDVMGQKSRLRQQNKYTPFVSDFIGGLRQSLQQSSTYQGLSQSFETVKEVLKESLAESWGIEDDEDSDDVYEENDQDGESAASDSYYQYWPVEGYPARALDRRKKPADDGRSDNGNDVQGSAPPHTTLENYVATDEPDRSADRLGDRTSLRQNSEHGSVQSIPQAFFNIAMEVEICSLSRCNSCQALLYDEQIMAGWSADDSNLNTSCQFCPAKLVPLLQIRIKDLRQSSQPVLISPSQSVESILSTQSMPNVQLRQAAGNGPDPKIAQSDDKSLLSVTSTDSVSALEKSDVLKASGFMDDNSPNASLQTPLVSPDVSTIDSRTDNEETINESQTEDQPDKGDDGDKTDSDNAVKTPQRIPIVKAGHHERRRSSSESMLNGQESEADGKVQKEEETEQDSTPIKDPLIYEATVASNAENNRLKQKAKIVSEPISMPYLSPLVLRKEIENVMDHEGDLCLTKSEFVDEHPIIFWNLVYYFKRLEVPSHLPGFILTAKSTNRGQPPPRSWQAADSRHVTIRAVWDNLYIQEDMGQPMYILYNQASIQSSTTVNALVTEAQIFSKGLMQHIVSSIVCNDVLNPIRLILNERRKHKDRVGKRFRSMYRDILFLSFTALGHQDIDHDAFDREYRRAFRELSHRDLTRIQFCDRPPGLTVNWCRRLFGSLEL